MKTEERKRIGTKGVVVCDQIGDSIENKILTIRGVQVILDRDLAELYGVETRALNQAVSRNIERFPSEFRFQITKDEMATLKSQFVISSWGGTRKLPFAFTEQGVAMLSALLRSPQAVATSVAIMKAFVAMRQYLIANAQLFQRINAKSSIPPYFS